MKNKIQKPKYNSILARLKRELSIASEDVYRLSEKLNIIDVIGVPVADDLTELPLDDNLFINYEASKVNRDLLKSLVTTFQELHSVANSSDSNFMTKQSDDTYQCYGGFKSEALSSAVNLPTETKFRFYITDFGKGFEPIVTSENLDYWFVIDNGVIISLDTKLMKSN